MNIPEFKNITTPHTVSKRALSMGILESPGIPGAFGR
jgi:hypothetical protein